MKRNLLLAILTLMTVTLAFGQRQITGQVTSTEDGGPLPGVSVIVKGTIIGTTTNFDGQYSLDVPDNYNALIFSFIGMKTKEVTIGATTTLNVTLDPDVLGLDEVVVTAFGIERAKKALSYSTQEITGDQVSQAGQPNVTNALQGKVAGVIVRQSSGMPGSSSHITIRGSSSVAGNNQPLYVVDGMPISSGPPFAGGVSGADYASRALDLNPEDIESINVLKGAAAAALYGLRASNGVVVITTKKGRQSKGRTSISYSTNLTFDQVSRLPDLQQTYAQGSAGVLNQGTSLAWGPRIDTLKPYNLSSNVWDGDDPYLQTPQVYDNVSPFFQTGHTWNNNVSIQGSGAFGNYAAGFGMTNQEGIIPGTGMSRINGKLAGDFLVSDKIKIYGSANFSDMNVDKIPGGSNLSNPLFTVYAAPVSYDLWGLPYARRGNQYAQLHYRGAMDNPRWGLENNKFDERTRRLIGTTGFEYQPTDWINVNYRIGTDFFMTDGKEVYELGSGETGGRTATPSGGQIVDFSVTNSQINSNLNIALNRNLTDDLRATLLVGNEIYDINERRMTMQGNGITIGGFNNISNTRTQIVVEELNRQRVFGLYSNFELDYKSYLFLNASLRNDVVSNMPSDNRSFMYPSIGLGFVFTEAFDLEGDVLSFGKVRASFAQVGQAGPLYSTRNIFIQGSSGSGFLTDGIQFPFNGQTGFTLSSVLRSDALKPQNTNTIELGFDLRFFQNRIGIDYTYYSISAKDQIFAVPIAASSGYTSELRNAGLLETKGHEIMLHLTPVKTKDVRWDIMTNFSTYENNVIELAEGVENIFLGGFVVPNVRAQIGQPYPVIFGSRYLRDGEGRIVVENDVNSPYYGMPIEDPEQGVIGTVQPDFEVSFINTLSWKGFSLTAQLDWRKGGQMYAGNTRLLKLYGMDAVTEDREGTIIFEDGNSVKGTIDASGNVIIEGVNDIEVDLNALSSIGLYNNELLYRGALDVIDESNVYETTFIRLREIVISYEFPKTLFTNGVIKGASVYFTGRNLFLITDYPNFDPETSTGGASNFQGLEYVALPQVRSFGAGLRVRF